MGKKIIAITLCFMLVVYSQLTVILFVAPLKAEAANCGTSNYPTCVQDLTQANWLSDTTNGFEVSGIAGNDGIHLFTYSNDAQFPAGYYFNADEYSTPKSIRISAGESFSGGVFDLKTLKINTINSHAENDALSLSIQGYDEAGNPKGNPVVFKTIAKHDPIYDIPINLEGINSFIITASVQFINTVQAGLWDLTFTEFTIDIPNNNPPNNPPTSSNGTVNVNEGQMYTFDSTSFTFNDADAGDTLKQIQISTIPNSGQLFLDNNNNQQFEAGEAIANGETISKADLDVGKLKYMTENGSSASFTFKVSDGIDYSTVYTMNLVVNARPSVTIPTTISSPTNSNPISITIVFSEPVTGLAAGDITVTNGTILSITGSGATYTAQISPSVDGAVKIKIPENVVANSSGALNKASAEYQIIYDSTPPTNIELSNTTIEEKKPIGTTVGTMTATDSGSAQTFTYSLQSGDISFFTIDGNVLKTNAPFAYDTKNSYKITIRVTDAAGNTFDKEFTIQITKNHAPTGTIMINGGAGYTNTTNVTLTMTASDLEGEAIEMRLSNDGTTWSGWEPRLSSRNWTLSPGEGSKTVYMQLRDTAGNISNTLSNTIVLDTTPPTITGVTNNGVYNTDVTISFSEGTATLNGALFTSGSIVSTSGNYTLVATDNAGNTTTVSFVIDKTMPQAVEVTIKSNNHDPTKAKIGDTITLTIKTDKSIQAPTVKIAGKAATVNGAATNWQATYMVTNGDMEGTTPFTINFKDLLGTPATEVTDVTDGSYVIVDSRKPTVQQVTMASNNANPLVAKVDDIITIDFVTSEDIQSPNVTILGQTAIITDKGDGDAKTWQASYTLKSGDTEGPISFAIDYRDLMGHEGIQVTEVSSGSIVIFDKKSPEVTAYFPIHQAMDVQFTENLVLTFNEKVLPVTNRNIVIRNSSDNQVVETIEVTQANVSIINESVTINPTLELTQNTAYSIQIDAGAFTDLAGNVYEGITDNTTWNFTTGALPTYTVTYDGNGAEGGKVPIDSKQYIAHELIKVIGNTGNLMKVGYTFIGWNTRSDGKGVTYKEGQTIQMGKVNLMLYAVWTKNIVPGDGGSSTPSPAPEPGLPSNQVKVNVVDPNKPNEVLLQTVLTRLYINGEIQDTVAFSIANAQEFLRKLVKLEEKQSRIVIPNMEPSASETKVILAKEAAKLLVEGKSSFGIDMRNVKIEIPYNSMSDFNEDIYFRIVPIKSTISQEDIEERERALGLTKGTKVKVISQPLTIETNLQNRQVSLLLPLPKNLTSVQERNIRVYVEHSNGTSELLSGRLVEFNKGQTGIIFDVQHFSTFSLVHLEQKELERTSVPYIQGYEDGTFRPNESVTRSQMAAMLARSLSNNNVPEVTGTFYRDTAHSWAKHDIEYIRTQGIMEGRQDHSFGPNDEITRAQMAVIAMRWLNKQCSEETTATPYCNLKIGDKKYHDVASTHWAAQAIEAISEMEIMVGSGNGQFSPDEKLTRAQAVKVLNRIFNRPIPTLDSEPIFKDIPKEHWAFFEIQAATMK